MSKYCCNFQRIPCIDFVFSFFARVDRVLRRSLGVDELAPTDDTVKPAPPVDPELPSEEELTEPDLSWIDEEDDGKAKVVVAPHLRNDVSVYLYLLALIAHLSTSDTN